ncbi:hypothetical protein D3C85_1692240 [compost metagenome]
MHALALATGEAAPGAGAQMSRIHIAQGLMDDVIVYSRPRTQGRQPRRSAQGHGIEHTDRIQGVGLLFNHRQGLRDGSP